MIIYKPSLLLKRVAPEKLIERLVSQRLTLNMTAVKMLERSSILTKKQIETTALKVIKGYRERFGDERKAGLSVREATKEAVAGKRQMVNRVQNTVLNEVSEEIRALYLGEFYEWLPSEAVTPDPIHQLNYGKIFRIGRGEMPGERWGCQCGMRIIVDEDELQIGDIEDA